VKKIVAAAVLAFAAMPLFAGNGKINNDGTITLTVDFRFPPTPAEIDLTKQRFIDFSAKLWDASEGQMRISSVTIGCGTVDEDLADIWITQQLFAMSAFASPLGVIGVHYQQTMTFDGAVMFHEFGHYGFKLGDEYAQLQTQCGGRGRCIDGQQDAQNHCIMQDEINFDNEFCVAQNHDPLRGNNAGCANKANFGGAPCLTNCESWNTITKKYEASDQQRMNGQSCWETLAANFPFLKVPNGLPAADPPPGFIPPQFDVKCDAASTIVLVLDKSGSMSQPVDAPSGEICQNGVDDDDDQQIDESPCSKSRLDFVHAAARQLIDAAAEAGARLGVVSFDNQPHVVSPIIDLDANNAPSMKALTDAITAQGATAIGDALVAAKQLLDADPALAASKAVIIVTDGANTAGIPPSQPVPDYVAGGIRIFPVATGAAADDPTLASIANKTNGVPFASPKPSQMLLAANEAWTQWRGETQLLGRSAWATKRGAPSVPRAFLVDQGTTRITLTVAGEMEDMRGFGVRARLTDPNGKIFDSMAPPASMHVADDPFFVRAEIQKPAAGLWYVEVRRKAHTAMRQHGSLAVTSTHRRTRLIATGSRWTAKVGDRITLDFRPWVNAPVLNAHVKAILRRPDGTLRTARPKAQPHGVYTIALNDLRMPGTYALTATFTTDAHSRTESGEAPGRVVRRLPPQRVPRSQRTVTRYFVVSARSE
jgi:hypothetical protein